MFLRFVDGKFKGGEFPLKANREITIGRGSEHDMVLDEDMVSRSHARISTFDGEVVIEDLGSTNGTLVNGVPVQRKVLQGGDQITFGNSLLELQLGETETQTVPSVPTVPRQVAHTIVNDVRFVSGKVGAGTHTFVDLIDDMKAASANGIFEVTHGAEGKGRLVIENGDVIHASLELPSKETIIVPPTKAFLRIVLWSMGRYKFSAESIAVQPTDKLNPKTLEQARITEFALADMYQEFIPPPETPLKLCLPLTPKLSDLSPEALDTLQLAMNYGRVRHIVDRGVASDFEIYQDILYLLQNGYLTDS